MAQRLVILIAGGTEESRDALWTELTEKLNLMRRNDDDWPRLWSTSDDPSKMQFSNHKS